MLPGLLLAFEIPFRYERLFFDTRSFGGVECDLNRASTLVLFSERVRLDLSDGFYELSGPKGKREPLWIHE